MTDSNYYTPQVVLAVGAHADDIDISCGGSLARWAADGAAIYYLILTDSSCGSDDESMTREQLAALRQDEQRAAAKLLGAIDVFFGGYCDGCLEVTQEVKRDVARVIRRVKPDTVITMDPTLVYSVQMGMVNHTDHRAAGQATIDAFYPLARDRLSLPELLNDEHLQPHKTTHLLLVNFDDQNYYVDVSSTFETKLDAIMLHASQFSDRARWSERLAPMAEKLGTKLGARYAEGFMRIDVNL